jgi:hypothetical protein
VSARQGRPDAYLQYSNAAAQNIAGGAGTTAIVALATDQGSYPNGLLDKPTTSQFRALRDCTVRVSYGVNLDSTANDDGFEVHCYLNGTSVIERSRAGGNSRASANEPGGDASRTFVLDLNANDYIELRILKLEGGLTQTVRTFGTMLLMELIRLR